MSFWSSQTIIDRVNKDKVIEPFSESKVKESAYSLSIGDEIFITSASNDKFDKVQKIKTEDGHIYFIPPGQFAYILTDENIHIPNDCLAFISMKFKIKAKGLINVSGFHVDPGYQGKLIFAVYNAGVQEIGLRKNDDIFLIWFSSLDSPDSEARNKGNELQEISPDILSNAKNAETLRNLSDKIKTLEENANMTNVRFAIMLALLVPLNIWLVKIIYEAFATIQLSQTGIFFSVILIIVLVLILSQTQISIHLNKKVKLKKENTEKS